MSTDAREILVASRRATQHAGHQRCRSEQMSPAGGFEVGPRIARRGKLSFGGAELVRRPFPCAARPFGLRLRPMHGVFELRDRGVALARRCRSTAFACALRRRELSRIWTYRSDGMSDGRVGLQLHAGECLEAAG